MAGSIEDEAGRSGAPERGAEEGHAGSCSPGWSPLYLEIMELDWDWLEEVVAALSWEKPL